MDITFEYDRTPAPKVPSPAFQTYRRAFAAGEIVKVRRGPDAVVVEAKRFRGKVSYVLAPLDHATASRPRYIRAPEGAVGISACAATYTDADKAAAIAAAKAVVENRSANYKARDDRSEAKIDELKGAKRFPVVGDEVLIDFTDGPKWRKVGAIKGTRIAFVRGNAKSVRAWNEAQAARGSRRRKQEVRWIDFSHVIDVRKPNQEFEPIGSDEELDLGAVGRAAAALDDIEID